MSNMILKVIGKRTEDVSFSNMCAPSPCNSSMDTGTYPYEILTVEPPAFVRDGFVSAEFKTKTLDVVEVGGRHFEVGQTSGGGRKGTWNTVSLPPGLDPAPPPREWEVVVGNDGNLYPVDRCFTSAKSMAIKVREVRP